MASPLDIPGHSAARQLNSATGRFKQSQKDFRLAGYCALALVLATGVSSVAYGFDPLQLVVLLGALVLYSATKARMLKLERSMWWHQARTGLVNALGEQRARGTADLNVIDLRDSVTEESSNSR